MKCLFLLNKKEEYAEMFRGFDGVITDLTPSFGEPKSRWWNLRLFDTKWKFNYGSNSQIFKLKRWIDYSDGEQVQLYFDDGSGILSSYINSSLIYASSEEKVQIIASAFAREEKSKVRVIKYK